MAGNEEHSGLYLLGLATDRLPDAGRRLGAPFPGKDNLHDAQRVACHQVEYPAWQCSAVAELLATSIEQTSSMQVTRGCGGPNRGCCEAKSDPLSKALGTCPHGRET